MTEEKQLKVITADLRRARLLLAGKSAGILREVKSILDEVIFDLTKLGEQDHD